MVTVGVGQHCRGWIGAEVNPPKFVFRKTYATRQRLWDEEFFPEPLQFNDFD